MKRNTKIFVIFVILLLAAMIPFEFTMNPEPYVFGWLPFPLLYWWILIAINFSFMIWVAYPWLKGDKKGGDK